VSGIIIDAMRPDDWLQLRSIYLEGIASGNSTFETDAPSWEAWDAAHLPAPRLVARDGDRIAGFCALTPYSKRHVYRGVGDLSVYVAASHRGRGVGRALLEALIRESEALGFWTLQAGIFPENEASIALHEALGFRLVGRREKIGELHGVWRDVLLYERRSR
jgi:phosphinothricin acetyltransferase